MYLHVQHKSYIHGWPNKTFLFGLRHTTIILILETLIQFQNPFGYSNKGSPMMGLMEANDFQNTLWSSYRSSPPKPAAAPVLHIKSPLYHKVPLRTTLLGQSTHLVGSVSSLMLSIWFQETSGGASGSSWSPHPMKLSPSAVLLPEVILI